MRAAVYRGPRDVVIEEVEAPAPAPDGVVLDVAACGICGSDLHLFATGMAIEPGQILGHEFSGRVAAVGTEVTGIAVGDRVAVLPSNPCGECPACLAGDAQLCPRAFAPGIGIGLPGAFAEQVHVPNARVGTTIFPLPDDMGDDVGALLEPLAVAVHAVRQAAVEPGATAAVLGLGPIGQLVARVLRAHGVERIVGVERSEFRRGYAQYAGVMTTAGGEKLSDAVRAELELGELVDVVFECTGVPALPEAAVRLVRRGGTVVIVAVYEEPAPVDVSTFIFREPTVRGSSAYAPDDFAEALRLLESGEVTVDELISGRLRLGELQDAMLRLLEPTGAMKILIAP